MDIRHCIVRVGVGSGVLVLGKNNVSYILTCTHVLEDDWQNVSVTFCDKDGLFSIKTHTTVVSEPASANAEDIALLHCSKEIPKHYQAVKLLSSQHGRELPAYTFGFPAAFIEHGRDDRCRIDKNSVKNDQGYELLKLSESQALKGGFSGGPLLDAQYQHCLGVLRDLERPDLEHNGTLTYAAPSEMIASLFSDYLEVQSLSPYLTRLRSMYQEVVLNDEKGMTLADIYVEPYYGVHRYCFKEKDKRAKDSDKPFHTIDNSLHLDLTDFLQQKDILKLEIQKPGLILLLGYPGQGKTSFCKRLIYDLTANTPLLFENIYHIRLRNVANPADLANNALKVIQSEIEEEFNAPTVNWHNSLLILDGLDELNIKEGFQSGKIDDICKSLEQATEKYAGLRIVLTSRYGYIDLDALKNRNIVILRLEELSFEQQITWLAKYRSERFHPESPLSPEKLEEYHKHDSIRELLGQPILLHMIASLEEDASEKPNRAAIYDSLFSQLIKRSWSSDKQISLLKDIGLDEKMLRYALQDIAHAIFMSGKGYLRRLDLENLPKVKTIQDKLRQQNRSVDLWRTVMIAAYLDEKKKHQQDQDEREQAAYGIEFLHKSLYEYLCAEKIWRDVCNGFLSCDRDGDWAIDSGKDALKLIHDIFSERVISQEIHDYLIEIIGNHKLKKEKKTLSDRMSKFLPYCLEKHFLFRFDSNVESQPFTKAISSFRGFWVIISSLGQNKNYFINNDMIIQFGEMCCNQVFTNTFLENFNISYQILKGVNFQNAFLCSVNFQSADLSFAKLTNANLSGSMLKNANFYGANLVGADLGIHGAYDYLAFIPTYIENTNFQNADLSEANLSASINKVNFENAKLTEARFNTVGIVAAIDAVKILHNAYNIWGIRGLPEEVIKRLQKINPSLFEDPIPF